MSYDADALQSGLNMKRGSILLVYIPDTYLTPHVRWHVDTTAERHQMIQIPLLIIREHL